MIVSPIYLILVICLVGLGLRFIARGLPAYLDCVIEEPSLEEFLL